MNLSHLIKPFYELTLDELYAILKLRSEVFVVEQNCVFLDQDDKDQKCYHLLLYVDGKLGGYSRLVPPGLSYSEMAIGRVITASFVRGKGLGRILMEKSIEYCHQYFGEGPIRLGAQTYALDFYKSLGFEVAGEEYDEDGIPHVEMVLYSRQ